MDDLDMPGDPGKPESHHLLGDARRILVYGVTGSGKTMAAARISEATGIPWTSVDDLCWEPDWVQVPAEEQRRLFKEVCARGTWLLDTAYGYWTDIALSRAELVVALDYPRWVSLQRLVRRTLARVIDKKAVCNGNTETWSQVLGDDSILRWHFRSFASKRARIHAWAADPGMPRVVRFTRPRDLDRWIGDLGPVYPAADPDGLDTLGTA